MANKVTFDGVNKIIQVANGVTQLFFETDVYAVWKQWAVLNLNYHQAMQKYGGETLIPNQLYTSYAYVLMNGWKIQPYSGQHILTISSNVFSSDGSNVYVLPVGFDIIVNVEVESAGGLTTLQDSNLTQVTLQVKEMWRLLGLDNASSVLVTPIGRITTGIAQTFQVDPVTGNVIITRA